MKRGDNNQLVKSLDCDVILSNKKDFLGELQLPKNFKINNKDLLIVSLLEYICNVHGKSRVVVNLICNYLKQNNIISDKNSYALETSSLRQLCSEFINQLLKSNIYLEQDSKYNSIVDKHNLITNCTYKDICDSRYKKNFIEFERIGRGGFGTVYKAYNNLDNKLYAIKKIVINELKQENKSFYLNEVRYLAHLSHKNIVRYYTSWMEFVHKSENTILPILYIQMELCEYSLAEYLTDRNYSGYTINLDNELELMLQIVNGIKYIHSEDIIHGDVNPKNIFLNDNYNIKIGDFGLSKKTTGSAMVSTDGYGNALYMAPEKSELGLINQKYDIYSLGIIILELLHPFGTMMEMINVIESVKNGDTTSLNMDKKYLDLILSMLDKDYKKRPDIKKVKSIVKKWVK